MASGSSITNDKLKKYYREKVEMAGEVTKQRVAEVIPVIHRILEYINGKDPRFSRQADCVGSYWQGLKVKVADEFDFNVPLVGLGTYHWGTDPGVAPRTYMFNRPVVGTTKTVPLDLDVVYDPKSPPLPDPPVGYSFVPDKESSDVYTPKLSASSETQCVMQSSTGAVRMWKDNTDLVRQGDVVPFLVRKRFKELLTLAIRDLGLLGTVRQSPRVHGPALTVKVPVSGTKGQEVSVDFSPTIPAGLPFYHCVKWPRPGSRWPKKDTVQRIEKMGINYVAKGDFYWLLTFAHLEKELVSKVDDDGGCRKQCHRIMKKINSDVWCNTTKPVISSYDLKTIWFWEMEQYPNTDDWKSEKISERFLSMTSELQRYIRLRRLPSYFHQAVNLLDEKDVKELDIACWKITKFLADPRF